MSAAAWSWLVLLASLRFAVLVGKFLARCGLPDDDAACRCGHPQTAHEHLRAGTQCSLCRTCFEYIAGPKTCRKSCPCRVGIGS